MPRLNFLRGLAKSMAMLALLCLGLAFAQTEPSLKQIYETAQSGKLDQAQVMMQQVLIAHPNSGKAHFVQAELFVRQGQMTKATEALAAAERLAPGLPFAKAEAVQGLRAKLTAPQSPAAASHSAAVSQAPQSVNPAAPAAPFSWGLPLLLVGGVIVMGYMAFRRKPPATLNAAPSAAPLAQTPFARPVTASPVAQAAVATPFGGAAPMSGGLSGPQSFGGNPAMAPGYGQPATSGLGGKIAGGLATGLAVGAGMMAAQAIGKTLMGDHDTGNHNTAPNTASNALDNSAGNHFEPIANNHDMGGQNFGVNDTGSWDDGNAATDDGDWDS
jgi:hypothetical protein